MRRQQLEDRLAALTERLQEIEEELDSHQSKDWEELAVEREGDEVLE
ncbi:MAG: TraR/DksA family transcriptional regulator, partial [Roseicyclus sp.]